MNVNWWNNSLGPETLISVISLVATVFFGVLATWYARRGPVPRERQRDFSISLVRLEIFRQPDIFTSDFQFVFRGAPVSHVTVYRFIFSNTGKEPIVKEDFGEPIHLCVKGTGEIFDCKASFCSPSNLKINVQYDAALRRIVVAPLLLNQGDFASVDFIATNQSDIHPEGRIKGIKVFGALKGGTYDWNSFTMPLQFVFCGFLIGTMHWWVALTMRSDYIHLLRSQADWLTYGTIIAGVGVMCIGIYMFRSWVTLRRARYLGLGTEDVFSLKANENF